MRRLPFWGIVVFILACILSASVWAQLPPSVTNGAKWLQSQVQTDGSLSSEAQSIALPLQAREETYLTLNSLGLTTSALATGVGSLDPAGNTEFLARQILVAAPSGSASTNTLETVLLANQNSDGGFGDLSGYQSTVFDTSYAVQALNAAGQGESTAAQNAVMYLLGQQASDGSWSDWPGTATAYSTALAIEALVPYRAQVSSAGSAIQSAIIYLTSARQAGSDWGGWFINAEVLIALTAGSADPTLITGAATDLSAHQSTDGSWGDDDFTTALAIRALQAAQNTASPTQPVGSVAGYVVEAGTGRPISGATVFIASNSQLTTSTNGDGFYTLTNVPTGQITLAASAPGYDSSTVVANIAAGSATQAGALVLAQGSGTALVYGRITAQQGGAPIVGASVQLTGPGQYAVVTASDGSFALGAVAPGQYTLQISAAGYISESASVTFAAGSQYQVNQSLLLNGTYPSNSPIGVSANIVDASTGAPITGATLALNKLLTGVSDSSGTVAIAGVPAGTYQTTVSASGYVTSLYTLMLTPGSNGQLGTLRLYPQTSVIAPTALTLLGKVVSGLGGQPVAGATITLTGSSTTLTAGADGSFTLAGLKTLSFTLQIAAAGYVTQQFTVTASGYGTVAQSFVLPVSGGSATATSVQLSGNVTDAATGAAIANATIALSGGTTQTQTGSTGAYQLSNIASLTFTLQVSAAGYVTQTIPVTVSQFGNYALNLKLNAAAPASSLQVLSVNAKSSLLAATDTGVFIATVGNTGGSPVPTALLAEVTDSKGNVVADVGGQVPGTANFPATFTVPAASQIQAEFDWAPKQLPAGSYSVSVYAITPGTITRSNPHGTVLATGNTAVSVSPSQSITGQLAFNPPLVQAGTQTPVGVSALIVNAGNVALAPQSLQVTITDPASGKAVYSAAGQLGALAVNHNVMVSFGSWLPTATGNLKVHVAPTDSGVTGGIDGTLYVGNKATGQFSVDHTIVAPGNNTVHAKVVMQGVDVTQGISTDPLFFAVQRAVTNGGAYVGTNVEQFQNSEHCVACHIQSQSLDGLASSVGKATIDLNAVKYLATVFATSQQADGSYRLAYPQYSQTQTILGLWAMDRYQDQGTLFRNKLAAAMNLHQQRQVSGNKTYWYPDYWSGWWASQDELTALATKGLVGVLQAASTADPTKVVSYGWNPLTASGAVASGTDVKLGPDGRLYALQTNGVIDWTDLVAGTNGSITVSGLPNTASGLAIASDGSFYISGNGYVAHDVTGKPATLIWQGSGNIAEVALSPSNVLYGVNSTTSQLLSFSGTTPTVVLNNQMLNNPSGLAFDASGNLMVADTGNYDLVEVTPSGSASKWAQGLGQEPDSVAPDGHGGWYALSADAYVYYGEFYDPPELYHFTSDGVGERIADATNLVGITLLNGVPVSISSSATKLVQLGAQPINVTSELASLQQDVTGAAQYFLGTYQDGNSDVITQALRLWGMAEARKVVTDSTLQSQLNQAVAYLDKAIRGRQNADGGWGRYPGWGSDALVTAIAGLALDYSNPSAKDAVTRSAIEYLLNAQQGDGSWYSTDGIMSTRLASTSLVMDYMPQALDFLGGLDVDLYVSDTPKSTFANLIPSPGDTTVGGDGISTYHWHLTGVTSSSQEVDFDVNLPGMLANEDRPVAGAAYLEFQNSFNNSMMTVNLPIPDVKAVSGLGITVGTDLAQYGANVPVRISGVVGNNGVLTTHAQVQVQIAAPDGTVIGALTAASGLQIVTGGQTAYSTTWNTGEYLPGSYHVTASIIDDTGTVANTASTAFAIVTSGANGADAASLRTSTDKPVYNTTDTVDIADLVQNVSANTDLSLVHLHLVVTGPDGQAVQAFDHNLGELVPGAQQNIPDMLALNHAEQGQYTIVGQVTDATGAVLATGKASFTVADQLTRSLIGHVIAQSPSLYQGQTEICTDTLINNGTAALANQPIQQLLVSLAGSNALSTVSSSLNLASGQQTQLVRSIDTTPLAVGDYACALQAQINGAWNPLGYAYFHVAPPPIKLALNEQLVAANRVLVLASCHEDHGDEDGHTVMDHDQGDDDGCDCHEDHGDNGHAVQDDDHGNHDHGGDCGVKRAAAVDALLTGLGVPHHVSTTVEDFIRQFRSSEYNQYWVLGGLSDERDALSEELEEAVFRGNTLLVDGERHGWQNGELFTAAGVRVHGKLPHSTKPTVNLEAPLFTPASLTVSGEALRLKATTGTVNAVFNYSRCHGDDDGDGDKDGDDHPCRTEQAPAIVSAAYGQGRAMALGFDLAKTLENTSSAGWPPALGKVIQYLLPATPATILPHAYLPVTTGVQNQGIAVTLDLTDVLPTGAAFVDGTPVPTSVAQSQVNWQAPLAVNQALTFTLGMSAPAAPGHYALTSNVATITTGPVVPYGSASYPFMVADPEALASTVASEVNGLSVNDDDRDRRDDALHELRDGERQAANQRYESAIHELLEAAEDLEGITSTDVTQARSDLDTLIAAYELDWYASGQGSNDHDDTFRNGAPPTANASPSARPSNE